MLKCLVSKPLLHVFMLSTLRKKRISQLKEQVGTNIYPGYLACALLIPPNDDIILLLVNTIQKVISL